MKDAYELLRAKEADFTRVRNEVESLRITAALLAEDEDRTACDDSELSSEDSDDEISSSLTDRISRLSDSVVKNLSSAEKSRSGLWNSLKRAR